MSNTQPAAKTYKVEANNLTGVQLDYAVGMCALEYGVIEEGGVIYTATESGNRNVRFNPSSSPQQAGEIIDREGIATRKHSSGTWYAMAMDDVGDGTSPSWNENTYRNAERFGPLSHQVNPRRQRFTGPTFLVAAMRCFVSSKLGATVELPAKLKKLK